MKILLCKEQEQDFVTVIRNAAEMVLPRNAPLIEAGWFKLKPFDLLKALEA